MRDIVERARVCAKNGDIGQAYALYGSIIEQTSGGKDQYERSLNGEACAFAASVAISSKQLGTALDWYRKAIEVDPLTVAHRVALSHKVMMPLGMFGEARSEAEKAVKIAPDDAAAWRALANAAAAMGDYVKSVGAYERQVEISNRSTSSLLDKAEMLADMERYDESIALCREMIDRGETKHLGDVYHIMALVNSKRGNHEEAVELYKKVLELGCSDKTIAHFHMSLSLFSIGRYREGWLHGAERKNNHTYPALYGPMQRFKKPVFTGQVAPATIHVHQESGYGDNFALMRYLPMLADRGYRVRYEVDANLFNLVNHSFPQIDVVPEAKDYPGTVGIDSDFDFHAPIGELPHAFGTEVDTVPWDGPYLRPSYVKVVEQKIGLAWSAGIRQGERWLQRYGERKSLSFKDVTPLVKMAPENFVSLQVGPPRGENSLIADVLPMSPSWDDTAALVSGLDLVITPDTGLAHLAGAMGKPVWLMMHCHNHGWHFMSERPGSPWNEKSPWYPSVKIFRQWPDSESWDNVISAIKSELQSFLRPANKRLNLFRSALNDCPRIVS